MAILNFPTKSGKQMETVFLQSFRVNISEKTQLFKFYMTKSQDVYVLHNCIYYIHFTVILTHLFASIGLFSFLSPR